MSHAAPLAELATLKAGDRHHRFETTAVYLDAADRPMGARFRHRPTGFELHLLQIESVPQAFTWVKTFATSDQGEPHTQEHLLLLRGLRGRTLATKASMSLVTSVPRAARRSWSASSSAWVIAVPGEAVAVRQQAAGGALLGREREQRGSRQRDGRDDPDRANGTEHRRSF